MSKHKERTLNHLYNVTFTLSHPKITPVLKGSCRMQGPLVDEPTCTNTVSTEICKESIRCRRNQSVGGRLVSGTCNVCCTPCSSCFPTSQSLMESNIDEFSGETGMINSLSYPVNDISSSSKTRKCEIRQISEINSAHTSSSNLSFSANAEVKANAMTSDVSSATSDCAVLAKLKEPKSLEGLDDDMSCIVRADEANKLSSFSKMSEDRSSLQCSSSTSGKTINNQTSAGCVNVKNEADDSPIENSRQNESSGEANNKAPTEVTSSGNAQNHLENNHSSLKNDVASEDSGDLPADTCPGKDDQKSVGSPVSSDTKDALQSHQMDGSEDSDIEEQDVKVCDICGDAGREDLLAICCKCTDGAEHTYCMRVMVAKVPEGDWMCEECKFDEEMKNRKEDKSVKLDGRSYPRSYPTGKTATNNTGLTMKTEAKPSDLDGDTASDTKISGKRRIDDSEVPSAAKKQAFEPVSGSPKTLSPNKLTALSRESSFKNSDKGKLKSTNQISSGGLSVHDLPSWGPRTQTARGTFSKSNSFSSLAAKRKVQLVDEGSLPRQKMVRDTTGLDVKEKEGSVRSMSKSMSFRSVNTSRNNVSESKVKMLSPKFTTAQDKGQMQTKERNPFERKSSFRSERSPGASIPSKTDQRSAFRGDPSPLSYSNNNRDSRAGHLDKPVSLSRSSGAVARRTQEVFVSDEPKRHISQTSISAGVSAANKISSSDQRPNQSSSRDDSSSNSYIAERPASSTGEELSDGLSQQRESKVFGERVRESSGKRLKHSGTGPKSLFCQRCKGSGHLTDSCTAEGSELSTSDVSVVRNSREAPNGTSDLKAAIEAARLRKPGICRNNRVLDQSDDLATSNANSEATAQDQSSFSSSRRILSSNGEGYGVSSNSMTGSYKQENSSMRHLSPLPAEALIRAGNAVHILPSDEKSSLIDLHRYSQAAMSILSRTAIPAHEYIWQGAFEVQKSGRALDLCDGIQAHLSSCASPKVLDTVNKFPQKVLFHEVSRMSTWPIQFQEYGVKEDNIALFFFAKDIGSYQRCYKTLLENMIRNDMALKANLEGVELLIFPSNQLPEKSQRWNMMFFLWGVFRVKKSGCVEHIHATGKPILVPQDIPKSVMPFPENICCIEPADNVTTGNVSLHSEVIASKEFGCPLVNGNPDLKVSEVSKGGSAAINVEHLEPSSVSIIPTSHLKSPERKQFGIFQVGDAEHECKAEVKSSSSPAANTSSSLNTSEPVPVECGSLLDKEKPSCSFGEALGRMQEKASVGSLEKGICSTNGRKFEINLEDEYKDEEPSETSLSETTEPTENALSSDVLNHLKRPRSVEIVMQSGDTGVNQTTRNFNDNILVETAHYDKKLKTSVGGSYGNSEQTSCSSDDLLSRIHGSSYGPQLRDTGCDEALSGASIPECSGSAARYFFPVDSHPVKAVGSVHSSVPWLIHHSDNDRLRDRVPNLELALGGESNSQTQGIPPFLVGKVEKKVIQDQGGEISSLTRGIPPFLVGKVDKKVVQDHSSAKEAIKVEEDVSASLSLSLSFPFPEEEQQKGSVSQAEQAMPETRPGNTSLLFFGGLGDK